LHGLSYRETVVAIIVRRYPINRRCPISGELHSRLLVYLPADVVAAANPTYRPDFAGILDISEEDEFPIVEGPSGFVFSGWLPGLDNLTDLGCDQSYCRRSSRKQM
jgi:hypothetical protein